VLLLAALTLAATIAAVPAAAPAARAAAPSSRLCADLAGGRVTMELLGDSVAAGYPGAPNPWDRWWSVFASALPPGSAVWNGAIPGSVLADYLPAHDGQPEGRYGFHTRFAAAVAPTVLAVNFRLNDQWSQVSIAQWKANWRLLIDYVRADSPDTTMVFLVSPLALAPQNERAGPLKAADYIRALTELAVEVPGSLIVRWDQFMPTPPTDWYGLLTYDLVHPSPAGQRLLAAQTYQALTSYCEGASS